MTNTVETRVQTLEPGAIVELFVLDATEIGGEILYFHANTVQGPIWWQGVQYDPWPLEAKGFARTSEKQPTPKLVVANLDGSISELCRVFNDLVGAKFTRIRTFVDFLDAENFEGGVNPTANPDEQFPPEVWYIDRKSMENNEGVEFELASAFDLAGVLLPRRIVIANYCTWKSVGGYRGPYCGYTGPAVAKLDDTPTTDLAEDDCGGKIRSCKLRQWPDDVLNFGGYPAAGLMRT